MDYYLSLLNRIEEYWHANKKVPSYELLADLSGLSLETIEEAFEHEDFRELLRRSYFLEHYSAKQTALSTQQLFCLNVLANQYDRRSVLQKLKEIKITTQQFNRWMQDPVFSNALNNRVEASFEGDGYRVFQSILEQASNGDVNAQKFYMELTNRYTPTTRSTNTNVNVSVKAVDLLVEVLQRHLSKYPDGMNTLEAIGKDFERVLSGEKISGPELSEFRNPPVEMRSSSENQAQIDKTTQFIELVSKTYEDELGF